MIGLVRGRLLHEEPTQVLVDVSGVGYELTCPVGTASRAESGPNQELTFIVHTALRQDALELFGFASAEDRAAFRQLIHVPNVGPKLAIAVLSAMPLLELTRAIEAEDSARLTRIPGVGKKTAERLILELRGKLQAGLTPGIPSAGTGASTPRGGEREKLLLALTGLGYRAAEAERAAERTLAECPAETDLSTLLRHALRLL
jgi:holliday junction DNA helicase RuvA